MRACPAECAQQEMLLLLLLLVLARLLLLLLLLLALLLLLLLLVLLLVLLWCQLATQPSLLPASGEPRLRFHLIRPAREAAAAREAAGVVGACGG